MSPSTTEGKVVNGEVNRPYIENCMRCSVDTNSYATTFAFWGTFCAWFTIDNVAIGAEHTSCWGMCPSVPQCAPAWLRSCTYFHFKLRNRFGQYYIPSLDATYLTLITGCYIPHFNLMDWFGQYYILSLFNLREKFGQTICFHLSENDACSKTVFTVIWGRG